MEFTIFDIMLKVFAANNSNIYALENDDYFDCFSIKPEPKPSTSVNPVKAIMPIDIQNIIYNNDKEHKKEELKTRERNISKYLITGTRTKSYSPNEEKLITEICDANTIIFSKTQAQIKKFIKNSSAIREFYVLSKNKNYWLSKEEVESKLKNVDLETPHIALCKSLANTFNETYIDSVCSKLGLESIKADSSNIDVLLTSAIFIALIDSDFYAQEKYASLKEKITKNLSLYVDDEIPKLNTRYSPVKKDLNSIDIESLPKMVYWSDKYLINDDFTLVLGQGLSEQITVNITKEPHILIGGSVCSGKSTLLKLITMQCIKKGAEVFFIDYGGADSLPVKDEKYRIIRDENKLIETLLMLANELERRKEILLAADCRNIIEFNNLNNQKLSRIFFVCDEISILDEITFKKEIGENIQKMLNDVVIIGNCLGIHLILVTQNPHAYTLNCIKDKISFRICGNADIKLKENILDSTYADVEFPKNSKGAFVNNSGKVFKSFFLNENTV